MEIASFDRGKLSSWRGSKHHLSTGVEDSERVETECSGLLDDYVPPSRAIGKNLTVCFRKKSRPWDLKMVLVKRRKLSNWRDSQHPRSARYRSLHEIWHCRSLLAFEYGYSTIICLRFLHNSTMRLFSPGTSGNSTQLLIFSLPSKN